jgi:hypothetical protein
VPGGTATWTFTGGTNYNNQTSTAGVTITQATSSVTLTCPTAPQTYTGSAQIPCTASYSTSDGLSGPLPVIYTNNINAGMAGASTNYAGDINHTASGKSGSFTINKADARFNVLGFTGIYDGNAHGASGSAAGVESTPADLSALLHLGASFTSVPGGTAHWTFDGNINYNMSYGDAAIVINKATLTITPDGAKSKIFGATFSAFTGVMTGLKGGDAVTATYNSAGSPASALVGSYDITVATYNFTSGSVANYTTVLNTAAHGLMVTYNVCAQYDQTQPKKLGSTVPVKLQLCDVNGTNYSSASIVVHATGLAVVGMANNLTPDDSGNANPDNDFRYDGTQYIFNLSTKNLSTGAWLMYFTASGDPSPAPGAASHLVSFQLK